MENSSKPRKGAYFKGELQNREIKLRVCETVFEMLDDRAAAENVCLHYNIKKMIYNHLREDLREDIY